MNIPSLDGIWASVVGLGSNNYVIAVLTLIIGFVVAWLVSMLVGMILRSTNIDNRLASWLGGSQGTNLKLESLIPRVVSWVIIIYALIGALGKLNLGALSSTLETSLPRILYAALLGLLAWILAKVASVIVEKIVNRLDFGKRLEQASLADHAPTNLPYNLGQAAFWLVILFFIPGILGVLQLQGVLGPVQNLVNSFMAAIPNLIGAGLILLIGSFLANILRQIVTNLSAVAGADQLGYRASMNNPTLSSVLGTIVYALVMVGVIIAALGELHIDAISRPATTMLTTLLDAAPKLFGAGVVLAAAYFLARLLANLASSISAGLGVNRLPKTLGMSNEVQVAGKRSVSDILGYVVLAAVMLVGASIAADMLGWSPLTTIITSFVNSGGNIISGLLIFAIGLFLANKAAELLRQTGGSQAGLLATAARVAILVLSTAMALRQMNIADEIINLAFGITLGAIGVAFAIAFGLGARDSAGQQVEKWFNTLNRDDK